MCRSSNGKLKRMSRSSRNSAAAHRRFGPPGMWVWLVLCALLWGSLPANAQSLAPFNQRDDQYRLLGLKRAKEAYEVARSDYERQKELYKKKFITAVELERARSNYADAEVNYQQSLLAVLFEEQYVSVAEAVKYHAEDGTRRVRLTLANTSGGTAEFRKLINIQDELFRSLQPDVINNVYVSLINDDNAIISRPYESKVAELRYGEPYDVDFTLLQDLDVVTVSLIYGNGNQRSMKIFLQKDATVNKVAVQSEEFSQEVDLGASASFDLTLELYSGVANTFSLEVVNLPAQIGRYFRAAGGQVRLSQLKFTESAHTKIATLEVSLPDRPTEEVAMDVPIPFYVLVIPREQKSELSDVQNRRWTQEEIEALSVGFVRLELVPRGKGRLLVRAPQLYHAVDADEAVEMNIELFNEGNRRIDNIEVKVDLPLNWTKQIDPSVISSLAISEDARIELVFIPPDDIAVGKYEIRIRTTGMSNNQPVIGEDKTVTVEIRAHANVLGTALIILLIVGLVGGMVVYGVKLSRR